MPKMTKNYSFETLIDDLKEKFPHENSDRWDAFFAWSCSLPLEAWSHSDLKTELGKSRYWQSEDSVVSNALRCGLIASGAWANQDESTQKIAFEWGFQNPDIMSSHKMGLQIEFWKMILNGIFTQSYWQPEHNIETYDVSIEQAKINDQAKQDHIGWSNFNNNDNHTSWAHLMEQRKSVPMERILEEFNHGKPLLFTKILGGKIEQAQELLSKGISLKNSEFNLGSQLLTAFDYYSSYGRHNEYPNHRNLKPPSKADNLYFQELWSLFLKAGGDEAMEKSPNYLTGPPLRAEILFNPSKPCPTQTWLRVLVQKEWRPCLASEKNMFEWLNNHGTSIKTITSEDFQEIVDLSYGASKAQIGMLVDFLHENKIQITPPTASLSFEPKIKKRRKTPIVQLALEKKMAAAKFEKLSEMGVDFLTPLSSYRHTLLEHVFQIQNRSKGCVDLIRYIYEGMVKQDPVRALEVLHAKSPRDGSSLMHWAAKNFDLLTIKYLHNLGLPLDSKDQHGNTILHWTAKKYGPDSQKQVLPVLEWLLEQGFDLSVTNNQKMTGFAALSKNAPIDALLSALSKNSQLMNQKDRYGKTPYDYIQQRYNGNTIRPIVEREVLTLNVPETDPTPQPKKRRL